MEAQPRNVEVFVAGVGVVLAVENVDCTAPLLISFASWKEEADGDNRGILYAAVMGLVRSCAAVRTVCDLSGKRHVNSIPFARMA